ncbi:MAG: hypothetical protein ACHP9T_03830 [Caulobacterales bacterium]
MRGVAILAVGLLCAGCGQVADAQGQLVETLTIRSAIGDYEKSGAPVDRCVKAKLVAAAYSDANDLAEAQAWQAREQEDCRQATMALHATPPSAARP